MRLSVVSGDPGGFDPTWLAMIPLRLELAAA